MLENVVLDDNWTAIETDDVAAWESETRPLEIRVTEREDRLEIGLHREVSADKYTAQIETFSAIARSTDEAIDFVGDLMVDLDESEGGVVALGADAEDLDDETFVHFYCVFEPMLPDGVTVDDIYFEGELDEETESIETTSAFDVEDDELDYGDGIRVEIYPVHEEYVTIDE